MTENFILNNIDYSKIISYERDDYIIQQISPKYVFFTSQSMEGFNWNHNNSDFNTTKHRVKNISKVESLISKGYSIKEIKQHFPQTQNWIDDVFSHSIIRVYKDINGRDRMAFLKRM